MHLHTHTWSYRFYFFLQSFTSFTRLILKSFMIFSLYLSSLFIIFWKILPSTICLSRFIFASPHNPSKTKATENSFSWEIDTWNSLTPSSSSRIFFAVRSTINIGFPVLLPGSFFRYISGKIISLLPLAFTIASFIAHLDARYSACYSGFDFPLNSSISRGWRTFCKNLVRID